MNPGQLTVSDYKEKTCEYCGKLFKPTSSRQQTCFGACKARLKKQKKHDKELDLDTMYNSKTKWLKRTCWHIKCGDCPLYKGKCTHVEYPGKLLG